jgi:hypothetical protein
MFLEKQVLSDKKEERTREQEKTKLEQQGSST